MREETLKKTALWGICAAVIVLASWAALKFALPVFLPFLLAYAFSLCVRPPAAWLCRKTKIPEKIWAAFIIVALSALITYLTWKAGTLIVKEAGGALDSLGKMITDENSALSRLISKGSDFLEKFTLAGEDLSESLTGMVSGALSRLSGAVAGLAGSFIAGAPSVLFAVVVSFIALFYFALDSERITRDAKKYLPEKVISGVTSGIGKATRAVRRFLKAYFTIMVITFGELLVGFAVIGINYAFLAALAVSLVDMLPVLGVGTVLVPWAVILFLSGEGARAAAILALFAVMYVVRQFIEPKIVGNCAGVHPLLALVSVYAGFKLAGVGGMIVGPVILNALSVFWEEKS